MRTNIAIAVNTSFSAAQQGFSLISIAFWLGLLSLTLTVGLKMAPVYMENWSLKSIFESLPEEFAQKSVVDKAKIRDKIAKRMNIEMIDSISIRDVDIKREKEFFLVQSVYEVREPVLGNVDVVMKFSERVEIPINR